MMEGDRGIRRQIVTIHHEGHGEHEVKFDELSNRVIGCAIAVHRTLGPGLLDTVKSDNSQFTIDNSPFTIIKEI
ncbi:MAG: hypothetical protein AB1414_16380 [bacterium]